ncbi:hypothetical protein GIB67_037114 [Kingdonia uniflora]|uniref:NADPH-dependent pterin aldehyde reductase n=1 Tax=Kingdonia uniflora TaxID=39325 RepID=A0A7J7LHS3_9MAGN|nr:hypothetical protein GIB67_037114 [Kingdonia uniflora]
MSSSAATPPSFVAMTKLPPRTILITGVSKGLGRALALEIAKEGHTVIGCSRAQDKLDTLQTDLNGTNNKHLLIKADVQSDSNVAELARSVVESKGVPDIIECFYYQRETEGGNVKVMEGEDKSELPVNNAGTINKNNKLWEVPVEEFDAVIDTNIKGVANVMRHFLPLMVGKKQGVVVNMSSGWGRSAAAQVAPYCASKWAIEGLTKSVAKELPEGMAIVALSPGVINTDMLTSCFGASASLYQTPEAWYLSLLSLISCKC